MQVQILLVSQKYEIVAQPEEHGPPKAEAVGSKPSNLTKINGAMVQW